MKRLKALHLLLAAALAASLALAPAGALADKPGDNDPYVDYDEIEARRIYVEYTAGEEVTITLESRPAPGENVRYRWTFFDEDQLVEEEPIKDFSAENSLTFVPKASDHGRLVACYYEVNGSAQPWYNYHALFVLLDKAKGLPHMPKEPPIPYYGYSLFLGQQIELSVPPAQGANGKEVIYQWRRNEMDGSDTFVTYTKDPVYLLTNASPANKMEWAGYYCLAGYEGEPNSFLAYDTFYSIDFLTVQSTNLVVTIGMNGVPDKIKQELPELQTTEDLVNYLMEQIQNVKGGQPEEPGKENEAGNTLYNITLQTYVNGEWKDVTADAFPKEGVWTLIPYPEGTNGQTHDFVVAHMFEEDVNGYNAGDIEYPSVTKTADGLSIKLMGTSPVLVKWTPTKPKPPTTGDATPLAAIMMLMAASAGMAALLLYRRKRA